MAQIKFTYSTETFSQRRNEDTEPEYLGTYDMIKENYSEEAINEAIKNAGQWVEASYKVTKTEVHPGSVGSKKGWAFSVYYGGRDYPNVISALYKAKLEAQEQLARYLKTGKLDTYGSAEIETKKKGKHLGDTPKKIKHLGDGPSLTDPKAYDLFLNLKQFTGTEHHYLHQLSGFKYTDGVQYLAEKAEAYWLIDKILLTMKHEAKLQLQDYQEFTSWRLLVNEDRTATLTAEDGNNHKIYSEKIDYTDFPLKEISLWFENGVLILPSEH